MGFSAALRSNSSWTKPRIEKSPLQIAAKWLEIDENINRAHSRIHWLVVKWCHEQSSRQLLPESQMCERTSNTVCTVIERSDHRRGDQAVFIPFHYIPSSYLPELFSPPLAVRNTKNGITVKPMNFISSLLHFPPLSNVAFDNALQRTLCLGCAPQLIMQPFSVV